MTTTSLPLFEYVAKDGSGRTITGEVSAVTSREALQVLRQQDVVVTRLNEKVGPMFNIWGRSHGWTLRRVKSKEIVAFTHQLSTLIRAGVPLLESLEILSAEVENPTLQEAVSCIKADVQQGTLLAEAFRAYPDIFHDFYQSMVEVGEATGRLDESLAQLAVYLEKQAALRAKIFSGLAYPSLLLSVAGIVLVFLLVWVVPLFSSVFQEMGEALPWLTQAVISLAEGLRENFILFGVVLGAVVLGLKVVLKNSKSRLRFDGLLLGIPFLGDILRKAAIVRFTRTLGFLVHRGVPLLTALSISGTVTGNKAMEAGIKVCAHQVQDGTQLSQTLRTSYAFPPMVIQMIKVGESTGSLDIMLEKIADLFEHEVDRAVATLTTLLEPCIILVVGSVIALVVVAMYLPIFSIGSVIG